MEEKVEKKKISVKDYFNMLSLKNHLIVLNDEQLSEVYLSDITYSTFINALHKLISIDSSFFFLDDKIIDKIEKVINIDSNRFKTDSDTLDKINEIIVFLNSVKNSSPEDKYSVQRKYLAYQAKIRKVKINNVAELLYYLAYDACIVEIVVGGYTDSINNNIKFLASLNYLIEMAPEALQEPYIHHCIDVCLDSIEAAPFSFKTKRLLRDTKNNYQRINRKEE